MHLLRFPPIYSYHLALPRVPGARHTGSSPQGEPFLVQIPSHTLSLSPPFVPYLENSNAVLSQAASGSCAWAAPDSPPHPTLAQRRQGRHLTQHFYRGWSVVQLCHSLMDYDNPLSYDGKQTSRRRTGKINLMNHELDVLPPYTIWLLFPFSTLPPSGTPPLPLQRPAQVHFPLVCHIFCLWCPIFLFSDWSRHFTLLGAGSKPVHRYLLRRLPPVTQLGHTCHLQPHQCPGVEASSNAFQPRHNGKMDPVSSSLPFTHTASA